MVPVKGNDHGGVGVGLLHQTAALSGAVVRPTHLTSPRTSTVRGDSLPPVHERVIYAGQRRPAACGPRPRAIGLGNPLSCGFRFRVS